MRCARAAALVLLSICVCSSVFAQEMPPDGEQPFTVRYFLKNSVLLSWPPDNAALPPQEGSADGYWRFRVEPRWRWTPTSSAELAFEQRFRAWSASTAAGIGGVLPSEADAPFRIRQLDWRFASGPHAEWRGEIDRAAVHLQLPRADVTIGRQAIGWGRGGLFTAVDIFAPFTPLEADREWRRGVDAVRSDIKLGDRTSLDAVAAFGETIQSSAFAGRIRGYARRADLEILGGYRAGDPFVGATSSAAIKEFELHAEAAVFYADAVPGALGAGERQAVGKAVVGGSYRLPIGNGLLAYGEYHYSGFGAESPEQLALMLRDPAFEQRLVRGDTQLLFRHATAVLLTYERSPEVTLSNEWLQSPTDGSGVVIPSVTWTISDRWSTLLSMYLPYGRGSTGSTAGSAFGALPTAVFVQVRMYR